MAEKRIPIKVWFDAEADFLEVLFSMAPGYMKETDNEHVMERVSEQGEILGFTVTGVRSVSSTIPLVAILP